MQIWRPFFALAGLLSVLEPVDEGTELPLESTDFDLQGGLLPLGALPFSLLPRPLSSLSVKVLPGFRGLYSLPALVGFPGLRSLGNFLSGGLRMPCVVTGIATLVSPEFRLNLDA